MTVPIVISETAGVARRREPVTVGVPFPRGMVRAPSELSLRDHPGAAGQLQSAALARWPDGSVKWALLDFQVDVEPHATDRYAIVAGDEQGPTLERGGIDVAETPEGFRVRTGVAQFLVGKHALSPGWHAEAEGTRLVDPSRSGCVLVDAAGREYRPRVTCTAIETLGPVRTEFRLDGVFADGPATFCQFIARLAFFWGSATMRLKLTLRNPRRARHPRNLWDLGDPGSVLVRDLSLAVSLHDDGARRTTWSIEPAGPFVDGGDQDVEIYQDSSGGPNWRSPNHVNRENRITTSFCGYRVRAGDACREGTRAQPLVAVYSGGRGVAAAVARFWQNFPKAIEVAGRCLIVRLFPHQYADVQELQGGEQKTHVVYLSLLAGPEDLGAASWGRAPLVAATTPEWCSASGAIPYLTPRSDDPDHDYAALVDAAIEGDDAFEKKREIPDEYGWRHFGDVYADHEAVHYAGAPPVISHYNNQYDVIHGACRQFLRSGDPRWFSMMDELAAHVVDIDVYHTSEDRAAYNHGLFWHTTHYASAGTGTHRSYSRRSAPAGGGPSNEHCYTTGLLLHHYLTGDGASRETVMDLAQWVLAMDDGRRHALGWVDGTATGQASATASRSYHGPGRGAGNAINALLDGFLLSGEERFLAKAEALIRRCIHPRDDIEARRLIDAERRWSYTVFLQTLGRYLDFKIERGELDAAYAYAQASLLAYARWMADRETPYLSRADELEFPTETWSAQEMRRSDVFLFAAAHARGALRERFLERAAFFFRTSVDELTHAKTRALTRPVALLMTCGHLRAYFATHDATAAPVAAAGAGFGRPRTFVPQRDRARAKLGALGALVAALLSACLMTWWGRA